MQISISVPDGNELKRIFHGRGKCFPELEHVVIDWIAPVVHITLYRPVEGDWLIELVEQIVDLFQADDSPLLEAVVAQYRDQFGAPREWLYDSQLSTLSHKSMDYVISAARQGTELRHIS